ncbi:hypothetical protein PENTCL1PPCAC_30750, partial [Pristionchus entomophagus]
VSCLNFESLSGTEIIYDWHGNNLRLSPDKTRAMKMLGFRNAIAFSSRPVSIEERVCIRLTEVDMSGSSMMRIGMSKVDPSLLRFVIPSFSHVNGFVVGSVSDTSIREGGIIEIYLRGDGVLSYSTDGVHHIFICGSPFRNEPIWLVFELHSRVRAVEFHSPSIQSFASCLSIFSYVTATFPNDWRTNLDDRLYRICRSWLEILCLFLLGIAIYNVCFNPLARLMHENVAKVISSILLAFTTGFATIVFIAPYVHHPLRQFFNRLTDRIFPPRGF